MSRLQSKGIVPPFEREWNGRGIAKLHSCGSRNGHFRPWREIARRGFKHLALFTEYGVGTAHRVHVARNRFQLMSVHGRARRCSAERSQRFTRSSVSVDGAC